MARMLPVDELQRRAKRCLHARIHDIDAVNLIEREVHQIADEHEASGQPGDAVGPPEQPEHGRSETRKEKAGQDGVIDAAMVGHAVKMKCATYRTTNSVP